MIAINCKTYKESSGSNAITLAKFCEEVGKEKHVDFLVCVPAIDLKETARAVHIPVYVQHADFSLPGKSTGSITLEAVKEAGAAGVLLNHSEKQISDETIAKTITRAHELKLKVLLCANTPEKGKELAQYNPDFIAVEPPELIGGKISVSQAKPEVITKTVELLGESMKGRILVGAGIQNAEDVRIAAKLGAAGVLLASSVTLAKDQKAAIEGLLT
ncbi:MAG: triose-phosphate isomerase [archaeon]